MNRFHPRRAPQGLRTVSLIVGLGLLPVDPARASYQKEARVFSDQSSNGWEVLARIDWDRRRIWATISGLKRALHERGNDPRLVWELADKHYRLRDYDEVIRLAKPLAPMSTPDRNFAFLIGLCHDLKREYRPALGYYYHSFEYDPRRLEAYVRIAQVRLKQGFPVDAAKVLDAALKIDPRYTPALEELRIVRRFIRSDEHNVYRGNNMVVTFDDHRSLDAIEAFYPVMEAHREMLEERLKYHIPTIWVRLVRRIDRHHAPPAFFDPAQDVIFLTEAALEHKDHVVFGHELAWYYLTRLTRDNAPRWLIEGLALVQARPRYLDLVPVRTTQLDWIELDRSITNEKRFLDFHHIEALDPKIQASLQLAYLQVQYLLQEYGWPKMREILGAFRAGETQFTKVIKDTLFTTFDDLVKRWNVFSLTRYYFDAPWKSRL